MPLKFPSFINQTELQAWLLFIKPAVNIVLILVLAYVLYRLARKLIGVAVGRFRARSEGPEHLKRLDTLDTVTGYVVTVAVVVVTVTLVLGELGISVAPVLAAAGVLGLAVGFGAQSLVKDYFTGFFLLLENQVRQGDVVEIGGKAGLVEEVTLRFIRLRGNDGAVYFVPNGQITVVSNLTREFSYALIEVEVAAQEDVDGVLGLFREVGAGLRADPQYARRILAELEVQGVDKVGPAGMTLSGRFKTLPAEQWAVRREFLRRLKLALDARPVPADG